MSILTVNVDLSALRSLSDNLLGGIHAAVADANRQIAAEADAHAKEEAAQKLHTRREIFVNALRVEVEGGESMLILDASARWIDDGMPAHSMLDDLLSSPKAKTAKDGSRYIVVPFRHGPGLGAATASPAQLELVKALQGAFKNNRDASGRKAPIPWGKIERDETGRPKTGLLHKLDVNVAPLKSAHGAGQGWGPIGDARQGPNARQISGDLAKNASAAAGGGGGNPFLRGVRVYQREGPGGGVQKSVMTFRVASSKHASDGRWRHPGLPPAAILDETAEWAQRKLQDVILPAVLTKLVDQL